MNIFVVDYDPIEAAKALVDKHVRKMILESAQMLSMAHRYLDGSETKVVVDEKTKRHWLLEDDRLEKLLYKVSVPHLNHPCTKWSREAKENYDWLAIHWVALMDEYKYRYGKNHACNKLYPDLLQPPQGLTNYWGSEPPLAMPDEYKTDSVIESYRNYYRQAKSHLHNWTKREAPEWLQKTK